MPFLALVEGWLGPRFAHFAKPLLIGVGVLLVVAMLGTAKCAYDRSIISAHDTKQELKVQQKLAPANDNAAADRASDTIAISNHEEEAHNAIHSVPDAAPAAPSVRLGCQRLRRAGKDISRVPACAGLASGH